MKTCIAYMYVWMLTGCILSGFIWCADLPCEARWEEQGLSYVCVCNSTYCDSIETPTKLQHGSYYHYKTSNSTPGFTKSHNKFHKSEEIANKNEIIFTINPSKEYQEIIGFGGSITDSVCTVINYLPKEAQDKLIESYFGSTGIEYNMLRIPIGSTDFSASDYSLDDVPFDVDLKYFSLNDADYNLKIPLIKRAMNVSQKEIKLIACTWKTPSWMKNNNSAVATYISEDYQSVWAKYYIKFLEAYDNEGLNMWAVSSVNEPMLLFVMPFGGGFLNFTMMLAPEQRSWLKNHLKPQLLASNYSNVKFLGLEDERPFAPYWMDRFANDPEAYEALDGIALHMYFDWYIDPKIIDEMHEAHPDKLILYTEASINDEFGLPAVVLGSWFHAEAYLYNMFQNLDHWASTYIDWNIALDLDGGPTRSEGLDCAVFVNQSSGEFYKQPMFYAMGHFSKFVFPGSKKVQVQSNQEITMRKVKGLPEDISQKNLPKSRATRQINSLTKVNEYGPAIVIPQVVSCLAFSNPDQSFTVMVINTKNETANVKIEDSRVGVISVKVEEHSVHTFIYWP